MKKSMINKASEYLIADDNSIENQIRAIQEYDNQDTLIDYIDGVQVWEGIEFQFSCTNFLELIKPVLPINEVIYSMQITFADILGSNEKLKEYYESLTEEQQEKFVVNHTHAVESGCEHGIGYSQSEVLQTIAHSLIYLK